MSATPRMRSGFPTTPGTLQGRNQEQETPSSLRSVSSAGGSTKSPTLPLAPENAPASAAASEPLIPLTILDAPKQRLYAFAVYTLLWAWRLYDWLEVAEDGEGSWGYFAKWLLIDFAFLFLLPELRIPWLELSQSTVTCLYIVHVIMDWFLMFLVPIPILSWLLAFAKVLYDREISVSEHNVKVSSILNNHSLIMGKQIINILPEGSAVLNPDHESMCISQKPKSSVTLPVIFNATVPAEIEFIRIDIETNKEETIKIPGREVSKLAKLVRNQNADPSSDGFRWEYPVKKPGVYRLGKVLDEYKLEVQRSTKDTYVVSCPEVKIVKGAQSNDRCIRDLSDLNLEVKGVAPLEISYSRTVNGKNHSFHFQSLQPDGFTSPLLGALTNTDADGVEDVSWIRSSDVKVALNESMTLSGEWEYTVEKVTDAFGNVVFYGEQEDNDPKKIVSAHLSHNFAVQERPKIRMQGCDLKNPLKIAKDRTAPLPVGFSLAGSVSNTAHKMTWAFSPIDTLTNSGDHGDSVSYGSYSAKNSQDHPKVSAPGLYTLKSVNSGICEGQVEEPSSCLVLNPLEPHLSIRTEEISDKCAGNSIGLRVDLDLVGTPPFTVRYDVVNDNGVVDKKSLPVRALRHQLDLVPKTAGVHKYIFRSIDDAVYSNLPLTGQDKILEQEVKPAASALIAAHDRVMNACLDSEVETDVYLFGDPPFNLEWEIIHDGKRKTQKATGIQERSYRIKTAPLTKGGEYVLALSSIQDVRNCRNFLQDQLKIAVRRQQPKAAFGLVESKRSVMAVEDTRIRLPLRLQGEGPWNVRYRNLENPDKVMDWEAKSPNDNLLVRQKGVWEIVSVSDNQCPGTVDETANQFSIDWFERPKLTLVDSESITRAGDTFVKKDVCEGDIDGFEVSLQGSPPYHIQYDIQHKPLSGGGSIAPQEQDAPLSKFAIALSTKQAGDYTYKFHGLADNLYNGDKSFTPLIVQQHVNAKPSASFAKPGQSFKLCAKEQEHEDKIPIKLTGIAPFFVEVEVKHQTGSAPEVFSIPAIKSTSHGIEIPREHLNLGSQQVRIRRVRDARGCQQKYDTNGPSIQIQVYDAPSIYPLETREDYCVGERIAYTLSGTPPFDITYDFNGRWNAKSQTTNFRRVAEKPGEFTIKSVSDKASECRAAVSLPKMIHPLPSVQISQGKQSRVDIHEGGEVDIHFDFWGTPPFEFTYTRSSNAKRGQKSVILETRHDTSDSHKKIIKASQEGTYEVVAIKDRFCSFSTQQVEKKEK